MWRKSVICVTVALIVRLGCSGGIISEPSWKAIENRNGHQCTDSVGREVELFQFHLHCFPTILAKEVVGYSHVGRGNVSFASPNRRTGSEGTECLILPWVLRNYHYIPCTRFDYELLSPVQNSRTLCCPSPACPPSFGSRVTELIV